MQVRNVKSKFHCNCTALGHVVSFVLQLLYAQGKRLGMPRSRIWRWGEHLWPTCYQTVVI